VRRAPLKDFGILAAENARFNWQCDCFVTKRAAKLKSHRKKSRMSCERGQSERLSPRGDSRTLKLQIKIQRKKQSKSQRHGAEKLLTVQNQN
jgi:hypothetical protein